MPAKISPELVIIATCARPYAVAAAQAGYRVAAFDAFNDVDTQQCCCYSARPGLVQGMFEVDELWRCLEACDLSDATVLYGSGLEQQRSILDQLIRRYRVSGNTVETVASINNPEYFFCLLQKLNIAHPETIFVPPAVSAGWLSKLADGVGGSHIQQFNGTARGYYQRLVAGGLPVSLLFLADGKDIEIVGYNEQWVAPTVDSPFRYGGLVSGYDLPLKIQTIMADAAAKVTAATALCGLNSMDFVLVGDQVLALEVNPRLSASFELFDIPDLLDLHIKACQGQLTRLATNGLQARASMIYYASADFVVTDSMIWPDWVADRPMVGHSVCFGDPVCSVHASAKTAACAKSLVFARALQLDAQCRPVEKMSK